MLRAAFVAMAMALTLGACSREPVPQAQESDAAPAASAALPGPLPATIPAEFQGRWGLVPADCTSTRGDAKGLLVVGANSLKFYESVAKLSLVREASAVGLLGDFAFTGEGQEWTARAQLTLELGGKEMILTETAVDPPSVPLRYTRCPA